MVEEEEVEKMVVYKYIEKTYVYIEIKIFETYGIGAMGGRNGGISGGNNGGLE